ncbi:hypothetical protein HYPBUDRAFT_233859 [Hyphopichia burtonii NRRL Y-1933]|uniref:Uncharacterized protein n=1 Tax=Hyphopichia burtonii NRRL Y-1933 TaxID=984485 RepID=A0A1E4RCC1_9ASCO|nr:hypothetical protein HYPBUDRAFT_233859 [Hyphopichia burtonii NRRL Y-1933]ODV64904.1 hypothetical protein HYPBUDRAFT_233859 [Hyphopichia burtonii NRRL Y-1933]
MIVASTSSWPVVSMASSQYGRISKSIQVGESTKSIENCCTIKLTIKLLCLSLNQKEPLCWSLFMLTLCLIHLLYCLQARVSPTYFGLLSCFFSIPLTFNNRLYAP